MNFLLFDLSDNSQKILNILALSTAMLIFCGVVLLKVHVWSYQQAVKIRMLSDQLDYETLRNTKKYTGILQ